MTIARASKAIAPAAYNAGKSAVDRYRRIPPYPEKRHYVNKVVRDYLRNEHEVSR
jgi:hypothetical protein